MGTWLATKGTQVGYFILGFLGVRLKNSSGNLHVRNNGDTGFADVQAKDVTVSNNTTGYDVTVTTSGSQTGDYTLTLPVDAGSTGQVLATNGSGVLSWVSAASTDACWKVETTTVNFGSSGTISAFTLPANAIIDKVILIVDTAFDGSPTLSVGDSGNNSRFMGSGDNLLTLTDRYDVFCDVPAVGTSTAVEIYYAAGGASVGSARVMCTYATPA